VVTPNPRRSRRSHPRHFERRRPDGGAQTGTGKTAVHAAVAATPHGQARRGKAHIRALVLTPTRELAAQVEESVRDTANICRSNP